MKTLVIIRHANASWAEAGMSDFDRPLSKRGKIEANTMGEIINNTIEKPSIFLSSPAKRAISTTEVICDKITYLRENVIVKDTLYLAEPDEILSALLDIERSNNFVFYVGHNPGVTDVVNKLTGNNIGDMPTCSVARIEFNIDSWNEVEFTRGKLVQFEYPD